MTLAVGASLLTTPAIAQAQNTTPAPPLFDWPLVAASGWPVSVTTAVGIGGTWQMSLRPLRDCTALRLVYANSASAEGLASVPNAITVRASLVIIHPGQVVQIRPVTFNGGNPEVNLPSESMIVSDTIPEYWKGSEGSVAYIRTYVRLPNNGATLPVRNMNALYGARVSQVISATVAPDLTQTSVSDPIWNSQNTVQDAYGPAAILGDADPKLPSVAVIGSSSVTDGGNYVALALERAGIPYLLLGVPGWQASNYLNARLRPRLDASCTHAIVQYGRNDLGYDYSGTPAPLVTIAPIEANLLQIWGRLRRQDEWVAQTTIPTRTFGTDFTNPGSQTPSTAEQPLRLPFNDWIRSQVSVSNPPIDRYYEVADAVEYFSGGTRTNLWNYALSTTGSHLALTDDGLHPSTVGHQLLSNLITATDFVYNPTDTVPPNLASARVAPDGQSVTLTFNEAKNPPLVAPDAIPGFSVTADGIACTLVSAQLTGAKQITLSLGARPIQGGQTVLLSYAPSSGQRIMDSASVPNATVAFQNEPVWNNSTVTKGTLTAPSLSIFRVQWTRGVGSALTGLVTLQNSGGAASSVSVTQATLGSAATGTKLPLTIGTVGAGLGTTNLTLAWTGTTAPPSGSATVLRVSGSYQGGTFTTSVRTTVP